MTWREGASTRTGPNDVPFGVSSRYRSVSSRPHTDLPSPTSVIHGNDDDGIVHEPTSASGGHLPSSSKVEEERGLGPPLTACPTRDLSVTQWAEDTSAAQRRDVWRQPYFQPSKVHEEMLQRESIRPPVFGGRSKNQQLGSVSESWGAKPTLEIPKGMFELEDDPPSPTFASHMTHQEIQAEKARRAALGIPAEKSGRPSIKDMEKERLEKLKYQQLRDERAKNGVTLAEVRLPHNRPTGRQQLMMHSCAPPWKKSIQARTLLPPYISQAPRAKRHPSS